MFAVARIFDRKGISIDHELKSSLPLREGGYFGIKRNLGCGNFVLDSIGKVLRKHFMVFFRGVECEVATTMADFHSFTIHLHRDGAVAAVPLLIFGVVTNGVGCGLVSKSEFNSAMKVVLIHERLAAGFFCNVLHGLLTVERTLFRTGEESGNIDGIDGDLRTGELCCKVSNLVGIESLLSGS